MNQTPMIEAAQKSTVSNKIELRPVSNLCFTKDPYTWFGEWDYSINQPYEAQVDGKVGSFRETKYLNKLILK